MLYLAQVHKNDFLDQLQLRLLACEEAENMWVTIPEEHIILLGKGNTLAEKLLVLVELSPSGDIERLQEATNWVLDIVQTYLTSGITPSFLQEEAERAEQWRQNLTLQNQDLARRSLELEARREQIQALEESLKREKEELKQEFGEEIKQEIEEKVKQEEVLQLLMRLLRHRFGGVSQQLQERINSLSVEQLENLTLALLDFSNEADLVAWLQDRFNQSN